MWFNLTSETVKNDGKKIIGLEIVREGYLSLTAFPTTLSAKRFSNAICNEIERLLKQYSVLENIYFVIDTNNHTHPVFIQQAVANNIWRYFKQKRINIMRYDYKTEKLTLMTEPR